MNNAELIAALRCCGGKEKHCKLCPSYDTCHAEVDGLKQILLAAADLIEAQAKRIEELEAQMPKEGEWIDDNGANVPLDRDGYTTGMCRCSVCGDWLIASDEYEVRGRYCPNCGAKMKGEQE